MSHGSLPQQKIQAYQLYLRNTHIQQLKHATRNQMILCEQIERMLDEMPKESSPAQVWAAQMRQKVEGVKGDKVGERVVDVFKVVEKFPNLATVKLLHAIVIKADKKSIDQLFQYDVMKLLHNLIMYPAQHLPSHPNDSTVCSWSSLATIHNQNEEKQDDKLDLVQCSLYIMAQLCKKGEHIRNFQVQNHRSLSYVMKAHNMYGERVEKQVISYLQATTTFPFKHYTDQFSRIISKVIYFFNEYGLMIHQSDKPLYFHQSLALTLSALKNLYHRDNKSFVLKSIDNEGQGPDVLQTAITILDWGTKSINPNAGKILQQNLTIKKDIAVLLEQCLKFIMYFLQNTIRNYIPIQAIYHYFTVLLQVALCPDNLEDLAPVRRQLYFLLSNILTQSRFPASHLLQLLMSGQQSNQIYINLVPLISEGILREDNNDSFYQAAYLIRTVFDVGGSEVHGIIQSSLLIQHMLDKLVDPIMSNPPNTKIFIIDSLIPYFNSLSPSSLQYYYNLIVNGYSTKLENFMNGWNCPKEISTKIQEMILVMKRAFHQ